MIRTEALTKTFQTGDVETTALRGVNLMVNKGEFVAVMGPSGCGKSTLLNLIGMLDTPSSGSYEFVGKNVTQLSERKRAKLRKAGIGFIFQNFNLIDELTVFENVELPLIYLGVPPRSRKQRVMDILDQLQLVHKSKNFPLQLSGGQQQRVAVARAIISKPELILADEPTGNLDSAQGEEVMNLLATLHEQGSTVIMVTHSQHDSEYAQRIIRLFDGQIINENIHSRI